MIQLGGPVFVSSDDPEDIAAAHVEWGYRAGCCPAAKAGDADRIRAIREAFDRRGVVIAEVGAWRNMISPDEAARKADLAYVCERLALADEVGALCCVDYAGTREAGTSFGPHEENLTPATFDLIVQTVREVLRAVAPKRTRFCLEMMQAIPPDSVDSYLALVRAIDDPAFAVHMDPVNILYSPRQCYASGEVIRDCIARLGPWIVSCHAKDLFVRHGLAVHVDECPPGTGLLDYRAYVDGLRGLGRDVPLLLEHLKDEDQYRRARDFVRSVIDAARTG